LVTAASLADTAGVRQALAAADDPPYVYEKLRSELQAVVGPGKVLAVEALGTYSASQPPGAQWSVLRLRTPEGARPYRLRWYRDVIGSYHPRSPAVASPLPLAATESGWIAWDLVHQGTPIHIERQNANDLRLRRGGATLVLVRRPSAESPARSEAVPR
ncbi:MAG TPA: hypothetical protein VFV24_00700, partial [Candidatus Eisenbacteria bacterium]|nr:hypothetical protein [Candidatus Eisenbacteria bacterium]